MEFGLEGKHLSRPAALALPDRNGVALPLLRASGHGGQFGPKLRAHPHARDIAIEIEFLVRRMGVVVRQRQAQQQRIGAAGLS